MSNVKQLNWIENSSQKSSVAEPFPNFKYIIINDERGVDWGIGGGGWNPVDSVEEAKTACQSDFSNRVTAHLSEDIQPLAIPTISAERHAQFMGGIGDEVWD